MFVKYCGFTREADVEAAIECGIDAVGFIFFRGSKRYVTPEKAAVLSRIAADGGVLRAGVFVEEDVDEILSIADTAQLDYLQVYDRALVPVLEKYRKIISAHRVASGTDVYAVKAPPVNGVLLLDTYSVDAYGGTGSAFDWGLLNGFPYLDRTLVAGGINENNVTWLVKNIRPYGIDVASGIEDSPGNKSGEKMRMIMNTIREAL